MRKTFVIAIRDYLASVKTKSFLISLFLMPVLMGGGFVFGKLSEGLGDVSEKRLAVIDRSAGTVAADAKPMWQVLSEAAQERNEEIRDEKTGEYEKSPYAVEPVEVPADATQEQIDAIRYGLSERVRKGELFAFIEIGPEIVALTPTDAIAVLDFLSQLQKEADELGLDKKKLKDAMTGVMSADPEERAKATVKMQAMFQEADIEPHEMARSPAFQALQQLQDRTGIRYSSQNTTDFELQRWLMLTLKPVIDARRLQTLGGDIDTQRITPLLQEPPLVQRALATKGMSGGIEYEKDPNVITSLIIPLVMVFLMFTVLMTAAQPLTMNIIEEKQLRIAEVLLGSVRPFELMLGKLLGGVAISLTLTAIYMGGGLFLANEFDVLDAVPLSTIAWFLVFAGLGTLMYGALFVAAGAAVTNLKEAQNILTPIILLVVLPIITFKPVHEDPNGIVARAITYFPLTTPTAAVLRLAIPPGIGLGEKLAAAALSLATTILLVWLAGRVFRFGMLHTDKAAAIRDMMRWVVRG